MLTRILTSMHPRAQPVRAPQVVPLHRPAEALAAHVQTGYLPILDGLRGVVIILVMLFHFDLLGIGWIGVQIFFVLSGFLITTILVKSKDLPAGHYFKRFYWRRTVRIMPVYMLYSAIMVAVFYATGFPQDLDRWFVSIATYTVNWQRALSDAPYTAQIDRTIGHFWSLGIEEQFYIFWPLLLYYIPKTLFKRFLLGAVVTSILLKAAFYLALQFTGHAPGSFGPLFHFSTVAHIEPFLFGALIACYPDVFQKKSNLLYGFMILFAAVGLYNVLHFNMDFAFGFPPFYPVAYGYMWYHSVINLFAAAILMACLQSRPWLMWLHNPALRFIGRISYGMYIYHYILSYLFLATLPHIFPSPLPTYQMALVFCSYLATVIGVAAISFSTFERFFLKFKQCVG